MKTKKFFYGLLIFVGVLAAAVVVITITVPADQANNNKQAVANTSPTCVARSLAGVPLVNGLGKDVKIPLFPGATRLSFADTGAAQYIARAYDSEILGFYEDRLRDLCWQKQAQQPNQVVYKTAGQELRLSLQPNLAGKTVIDYVVFTENNVLGQVKIAQAACTSGQYYCNGGCVASGTSCPAPTDASACSGGTVWCPSSSGSGGWCQMPPCPSSTATSSGSVCGSGQWWCNGACISMTTACNGYYPNGTTSSSGTTGGSASGSSTTCTGTYQQPGVSYTQCNNSVCPNGCTWDGNGCPNGCYTSSSGGNTTSSSCPSGQYWCTSSNTCIPSSSSCAPVFSGGSTAPSGQKEQTWNANGLKSWVRTDADPARIEQLKQTCANVSATANIWMPSAGTQSSVDFGMPNPDKCRLAAACTSGQYFDGSGCNGSSANTSNNTWPTDQSSCTSQAKFWCTGSGGGGGWCQTMACSTNYSSSSCPAGQWMCNNGCIATTAQCNGYYYNGSSGNNGSGNTGTAQTPAPANCTAGQWSCNGSCIARTAACNGYYADGTSVAPPSGTTCAGGYKWCESSQSCVNAVQPCYPVATPTQTQPTTQPQQQQQPTQPTSDQARNNQQFNQGQNQGGPNGQFGPGQSGPSEADQKRMDEQRFQQMKRGMDQFTRGVTQMKKFVDQTQRKLSSSGVGMPAELTNALAKAPELLAKLKAAKTADDFDELMGDMQDIGMIMQDWGPKLGELQRLASMIKNLDKDVKNMRTNFTRVQKAAKKRPELADPLAELQQRFDDMAKRAADVKELAKTDPESALDLIDEFYGNSEEFWNQVSFLDMVSNMTKGLTQANAQIRQIESRIRSMEKAKGADKEAIANLKDMLAAVKAALPELKAAMAVRPIDYEGVRDLAQDFWMKLQELQNTMAEEGQSFYAPTVQGGQGINIDIPEGFLGSPSGSSGGGFSGGGPGGPGPGGPGGPGGFGPGPGGPGGF